MKRIFIVITLCIAAHACEQSPGNLDSEFDIGMLSIYMDSQQIPSEVIQVRGSLSRPDFTTIEFDFKIDEQNAYALIESVPVGIWTVKVDAFNSNGDIEYTGSTEVNVTAGLVTTVHLQMSRTGSVEIIVIWDGTPELAAYYPFNGNANDESGYEHHGEVIGAELTSDRYGTPNSAYYFDGIDDVIALEAGIYEGDFLTITAWIKRMGDGSDPWNSVVAGDCSTPYFGFVNDFPTFGGQCGGPMEHQFPENPLADNEWHHLVGIYDGSCIKLYLDNSQLICNYVGGFQFDNTIPIGIGGSYLHFRDNEGFHGKIDEVRIYNGALSDEEIHSLYSDDPINIPDKALLNALIDEGVDSNADGLIGVSEAEAITSLNVGFRHISDMTGIEAFVNLNSLNCTDNSFHSLNVSAILGLSYLNCGQSNLTGLDVTNNRALTHLDCSDQGILELDVTNNPLLTHLNCHNNKITSLDLSNNILLDYLWCQENQLAALDISNNPALKEISIHSIPTLYQVCVWTMPFPPDGVSLDKVGSPNLYFTIDCSK